MVKKNREGSGPLPMDTHLSLMIVADTESDPFAMRDEWHSWAMKRWATSCPGIRASSHCAKAEHRAGEMLLDYWLDCDEYSLNEIRSEGF